MAVQKMQVVVQKTTFPQAARAGARDVKNSERKDLLSKNCSLNRDVECPSVGTIFAHSFSERSAMAVRLQFAPKTAPNPTDQHVGSRVRMRRKMLARIFFEGAPMASAPHGSNESKLWVAQIDDFVSDPDGLRLIEAFMRIDNATLRLRIVMLVQEIAGDDD
jgi:hypothetical protein